MAKKVNKQSKKNKTSTAKAKVLKKKKNNRTSGQKSEDIQIEKDFSIDVNESLKIDNLYDDIDDVTGEDLLI